MSLGEVGPEGSGEVLDLVVPEGAAGSRLDRFLSAQLPHSRSLIQDWLREDRVLLEARPVRPSVRLKGGERVQIRVPPLRPALPEPEPGLALSVVYEDRDLLVVDKPRGMVVHPGSGVHQGTLVNALLAHCQDLSGIRGVERPGIVHRLDKDTSGLLVVAKHDRAHLGLQAQFEARTVLKIYRALVHGRPPASAVVEQPIARHRIHRQRMAVSPGGRAARSEVRVLERFGDQLAWVEVRLHTGRTHQIRVHMAWLEAPLVGDPLYGRRPNPWGLEGQALHCLRLGFRHPISGQPLELEAPIPAVLQGILTLLRGGAEEAQDPGRA